MAQSRILKLNILADTKDLVDGLKKADTATQDAGSRIGAGFKKVGLAVAAAGAAVAAFAVKLAVDGVKAAIEDEAAQVRLATALKNTTQATDEQVAAVENQITKIALATGVADDKLRPALGRLAVATGDIGKAQDSLNLALDISAATGKDLEAVSNALGKAHEGNTASLGRLGIGMSAAEIKALGLSGTMEELNNKFGGAAQAQADTFQGKIARLQVAFDETKETIGFALIPILTSLFDSVNNTIMPLFDRFSNQFNESVAPSLNKVVEVLRDFLVPVFQALWQFISEELVPLFVRIYEKVVPVFVAAFQSIINKVKENKESFQPLIDILKALWEFVSNVFIPLALEGLVRNFQFAIKAVEFFIDALAWLMRALRPVLELLERMVELISKVGSFISSNLGFGGGGGTMGITVPNSPATPSLPSASASGFSGMGGTTIINVNGTVVDPEGAARAITDVLNRSVDRAGGLRLGEGAGFLVAPAI